MRCYGPKTTAYLRLTPSGLLPALELDGRFFTESAAIMDLLERAFPDNKPLVPDAAASPAAAARHAALLRLERRLFGDWLDWLVRGGGGGADFFSTLSVVEDALAAPSAAGSAKESERGGGGNLKPTEGPYFLGEDVSMCDLVFAPFLERISASIPYYKGVRIRGDRARFPALNRWFDAMETRESYLGTKSDYYTHVHDLPPQLGGCAAATAAGVPARSLWQARDHSLRVKKPMREAPASQARKRTRRSAGSRPMAAQRAPTPFGILGSF